MSGFWLKMIGTQKQPCDRSSPYKLDHVGFRGRKPSGIHLGDQMVLYAVGGSKRVFAIVEVTSDCVKNNEKGEEGWPYRLNIRMPLEINLAPSAGVNVDEISSDLKAKLMRRSHIRLTSEQYEQAVTKLRKASNNT